MNILIVDDEPKIQNLFKAHVEICGHQALTAESGEEAITLLSQNPTELVLLDLSVKGKFSGQELLAELKRIRPQVSVVVVTGNLDAEEAEFQNLGVLGFLRKPIRLSELDEIIQRVSASSQAETNTK